MSHCIGEEEEREGEEGEEGEGAAVVLLAEKERVQDGEERRHDRGFAGVEGRGMSERRTTTTKNQKAHHNYSPDHIGGIYASSATVYSRKRKMKMTRQTKSS